MRKIKQSSKKLKTDTKKYKKTENKTELKNKDAKEESTERISHDYDAAWKMILEAFPKEVVEILFPDLYPDIDWNKEIVSLDTELEEIQKSIFIKEETEKIISDKIIRVCMKDETLKLLFIHVEVQSYKSDEGTFGERMFRYFYRIWDKFKYKNEENNDIIAAAIYTYNGTKGKDKEFKYKVKGKEILKYNFITLDVENFKLESISETNPLKIVFKIAKKLLNTPNNDRDIFKAKIELDDELGKYTKLNNEDQIQAMKNFLEYLFLIKDEKINEEYKKFKSKKEVEKMTVTEIMKKHERLEGRREGKSEGIAEGRREGAFGIISMALEFNLSEEKIIENLQKRLNISREQAENYIKEYNKQENNK